MSAALQKIIRLSSNYFEKYTREQPGKKKKEEWGWLICDVKIKIC